ncbi:MAG: helix-turn-helix domain-containing protein [Anaerolineae bacterium]
MKELGDLLRRSREELGLTLDDVQTITCIQRRYLEALEQERFGELPDPVVGRGFLRSYASVLKLDPEVLVGMFDGLTRPAEVPDDGAMLSEKGVLYKDIPIGTSTRTLSDFLVGILAVLAVIGSLVGAFHVFQGQLLPFLEEARESVLPTEDAVFILPTPTPLPTYTPTPTNTPTPIYYTGVTVELRITEESWVQVFVDGVKEFEGILRPGDEKHWNGQKQVAVRVGNAGGVEAVVNGESMGRMGQRGQVVDQVWEKVDEGSPLLLTLTPASPNMP